MKSVQRFNTGIERYTVRELLAQVNVDRAYPLTDDDLDRLYFHLYGNGREDDEAAAAHLPMPADWPFVVAILTAGISVATAIALGMTPWVVMLLFVAVGFGGMFAAAHFSADRAYRRRVREELRRAGLNICVGCGYDRRTIAEEAVCPECGEGSRGGAEGR